MIFAIDVSGSMGETERQLAKTFFFFALQGIRRQYAKVEDGFHRALGRSVGIQRSRSSSRRAAPAARSRRPCSSSSKEVIRERFDPSQYNVYLFYASDGENLVDDREPATESLREICQGLNYGGFIEIRPAYGISPETEMAGIFSRLQREDLPLGMARVTNRDDVWNALRQFFQDQQTRAGAA